MASLRRAWRTEPVLLVALLALAVANVLPIWIGRYLPLLDLPNHLSAMAVWHYYDDPRFDFSKYYSLNLQPLPYWAHYYSVHLLAYLFGIEAANRLFLTLYAIALPAGALVFARRFGRSAWLALFAFPLIWNFNLAEGFIAYCAGFAALVWALAWVDRYCERPTLAGALGVLLIGSSTYFFHLLTYMLFLVCAGLLVLLEAEAWRPRRLVERGAPVLGCALVGLWAYAHSRTMGFSTFGVGKSEFNFDSLEGAMVRAPGRLLNVLASGRDEWVVIGLLAAWLLIAVTAARFRERSVARWHDLGPEVCFLVAALAMLFLPKSMQRPFNWYMINGRFVPVAALFGALSIRGPLEGWRRWLFAPVVACALFYAVDLARMVVIFNRHVDGFDQLAAQIPLHKATLTLVLPPLGDDQVNVNCFNQWASYTQIRRGGYNFYNFNYGFPLKYRTYLPAPPWNHAEYFNWDAHSQGWDYFLTHNEGAPNSVDLFSPLEKQAKVRLVAARGSWRLWQKILPEPGPAKAAP